MPAAMPRRLALFRVLTSVALAAFQSACSLRPKPPDPLAIEDAPPDFALAATVYTPPPDPEAPPPPRPLRPARYIMDPDLVLHAAIGPGLSETSFPPQTRRLRQQDADLLWQLIADSGLLAPGSPQGIPSAETYTPRPDRATAVLTVSYGRVRRSFRIVLDAESDAGAGPILDELSRLAWLGP